MVVHLFLRHGEPIPLTLSHHPPRPQAEHVCEAEVRSTVAREIPLPLDETHMARVRHSHSPVS